MNARQEAAKEEEGYTVMVELNENAIAYMKKRELMDIVLDVIRFTS